MDNVRKTIAELESLNNTWILAEMRDNPSIPTPSEKAEMSSLRAALYSFKVHPQDVEAGEVRWYRDRIDILHRQLWASIYPELGYGHPYPEIARVSDPELRKRAAVAELVWLALQAPRATEEGVAWLRQAAGLDQ